MTRAVAARQGDRRARRERSSDLVELLAPAPDLRLRRRTTRAFEEITDDVVDALTAGATCRIIRNGVEVAETEPGAGSRGLIAEQLVARCRRLPRIDYAAMRREADEFFGTEDRINADDDPRERGQG